MLLAVERDSRVWREIEHAVKHDHGFTILDVQCGTAWIHPVLQAKLFNLIFHRKPSKKEKQRSFRAGRTCSYFTGHSGNNAYWATYPRLRELPAHNRRKNNLSPHRIPYLTAGNSTDDMGRDEMIE
jgi:hypothetical protein